MRGSTVFKHESLTRADEKAGRDVERSAEHVCTDWLKND
jgi:hypothetical protein